MFLTKGQPIPTVRPALRLVGVVAQLVEHHNGIVGVVGSNPIGSTKFSVRESEGFQFSDGFVFPSLLVPPRSQCADMSGSVRRGTQAFRTLGWLAVGLVCLGSLACDRTKQAPPAVQPTNAPVPLTVVAPPPAPTNSAPLAKMPERTPEELFRAGLKLWEGKGAKKDPAEAAKLFAKAAEQGHAEAQAYLAGAYRTGSGVANDAAEAARWFLAAAEQCDARSQGVLASMYGTGEGVAKDPAAAVKWYRRAAEQGLVRAQGNLGAMLFLGQGVAKDPVEAYKWLHLAAQKGDPEAVKNRGLVAQKLSAAQMIEGRKRAAEFVPVKPGK